MTEDETENGSESFLEDPEGEGLPDLKSRNNPSAVVLYQPPDWVEASLQAGQTWVEQLSQKWTSVHRGGVERQSAHTTKTYWSSFNTFREYLEEYFCKGRCAEPEVVLVRRQGKPVRVVRHEMEHSYQVLLSGKKAAAHMIERFIEQMIVNGRKGSAINGYITALTRIIRKAHEYDWIDYDVEMKREPIETLRDTRGPGEIAIKAVVEHINDRLDAFKADGNEFQALVHLRNRAVALALFALALRRTEVVELDREHFDVQQGLWILGKARKQRELVRPDLISLTQISEYVQLREKLFPVSQTDIRYPLFISLDPVNKGKRLTANGLYSILKSWEDDVGILHTVKTRGGRIPASGRLDLHPHGWRHAAITKAVQEKPLVDVAAFARHRDPKTTMKYIDNLNEKQKAVSASLSDFLRKKDK